MRVFQVAKSIINCISMVNKRNSSVLMVKANGFRYYAKIGFVSIMLISLLWLMKSLDVNLDSI